MHLANTVNLNVGNIFNWCVTCALCQMMTTMMLRHIQVINYNWLCLTSIREFITWVVCDSFTRVGEGQVYKPLIIIDRARVKYLTRTHESIIIMMLAKKPFGQL